MIVIVDYREPNTNNSVCAAWDGTKYYEFTSEEYMDVLMDYIENEKGRKEIFCTNLSRFGMRIIYNLHHVGYELTMATRIKEMKEREFSFLASGDCNFYTITIKRHKRANVIINADNILSLQDRRDIMDAWAPGEYSAKSYALAVYRAVQSIEQGTKRAKPTISSVARSIWRKTMGPESTIKAYLKDCRSFKVGDIRAEEYFRPAYHGGMCYLKNRDYIENVGKGVVLDLNSMYPYIMKTKPLPYGEPHYVKGAPSDEIVRLTERGYIYTYVRIRTKFQLKENCIPCVSVVGTRQAITRKRGWLETNKFYSYSNQKYLTSEQVGMDDALELTLTYTDFKLFMDNYDVSELEYIDHAWFAASLSMFETYVDAWYKAKRGAETKGDARRAKMMLNSLSGSFARHPDIMNLVIDFQGDQMILDQQKAIDACASYVHIGAAITSYGRDMIIRAAQKDFDRFLYTDTDSLHLKGFDVSGYDIGSELGQFKIEHYFLEAVYYKQKMYAIFDAEAGEYKLTLAGIPKASTKVLENVLNGRTESNRDDNILMWCDDIDAEEIEAFFEGDEYEEPEHEKHMQKIEKIRQICDAAYINGKGKLSALWYCDIPIFYKRESSDGFAEEVIPVWRPMIDINQWAQM